MVFIFNHYWELLISMTKKELKARYKHTMFGFFWLVANPILQMLVIGFVFTFFMKEPIEHYYYYLFSGLLVWNFFSVSLTKATPCIIFERGLIKKTAFPRSVIPLSIILSNFAHLIAAHLLFFVPILLLGTFNWLSLPILLIGYILLLLFTIGLSLLTSALNVRFRDIAFFIQALLIIWFYSSPIVYSVTIIPEKFYWIWQLNPMVSILQLFQSAFIASPLPNIKTIVINTIIISVVAVLGVIVFKKESKNFDDWV